MESLKRVFVLAVAMLVTNVHAEGRLSVELRYPADKSGRHSDAGMGNVEVVLKNQGDRSVSVNSRELPFVNSKGRLTHDFFNVTNEEGLRSSYKGVFVEYATDMTKSYIEIAPGKSKVYVASLLINYAIKPGHIYDVSVAQPINYLPDSRSRYSKANAETVRASLLQVPASNPLRIWIDPRAKPGTLSKGASQLESPTPCSATQVADFNAAKALATSKTQEAAEHLGSLYGEAGFTPSARYTKWFGIHGNPDNNSDDDFVDAMVFISHVRISDDQSEPKPVMSVTCQCMAEDLPDYATATARVDPSVHYVVNACPAFWVAPPVPTVKIENSKVGTIVHEATHFVDDWFGGTGHTYPDDYDSSAALAISNRSLAVRNANNYKFYVLNQDW